jgi:hypothetical protein
MPYYYKTIGDKKCVYKKEDNTKVGCTTKSIKKYLAALHANVDESNKIKGGKADKLTISDIAKKFDLSIDDIKKQLEKGVKIEKEHTPNEVKATEIAMDHLSEIPDYYNRLDKMEKSAKKELKLNEVIRKNLNKKLKKISLFINESILAGKTIINVDIQPEYSKYINFNLNEWVHFINENGDKNKIIFLFNGYDTLGMVTEEEYKMWLYDLGIDEDIIYDKAIFYDKGYAFFRYCIDNSIDDDNLVDLIKYMVDHNITDSRDIDSDMWDNYMGETGHDQQDVRELLENAGDMINIPDLMDFLIRYNNITLLGGGISECLKEVELALLALGKDFNIMKKYCY